MRYSSGQSAFTLIELLVSLTIIIILALIMFSAYSGLRPHNDVDADTQAIISELNLARSRTLASTNSSSFGVHLQTDRVILFQGTTFNSNDSNNVTLLLSSRDKIATIALVGSAVDVVFDRLSGTTSQSGTLVVQSRSASSENETIYIQSSGEMGTTLPPAPGTTRRVSDARHVDFVLGWSIQNAITLEFYFPATSTTQDVPMASYFNADKSSFDTTQTFLIGGVNQTFRVHTLDLNGTSTTLSIFRDKRGGANNAAVNVRIFDGGIVKAIANYAAGSTVQVGAYGGTMTIQ